MELATLSPEQQFQAEAFKRQFRQMSHEQLLTFAEKLIDTNYAQKAFIETLQRQSLGLEP